MLNPIAELIQSSQLVITITPEGWCPSTIILESMILNKPTMNIVLDEKFYEFEYIKQNAVIAVSDKSDLENDIKQILFDEAIRNGMMDRGKIFVKNFLKNYGNSSKKLAEVLRTKME